MAWLVIANPTRWVGPREPRPLARGRGPVHRLAVLLSRFGIVPLERREGEVEVVVVK